MIQLYHGDCLEQLKLVPDRSVDMVLSDPPYMTTRNKWDKEINLELLWKELHRVCKPEGAILLFGSEPFSSYLRLSNIQNYKYDWIWEKQKPSNFQLMNHQVGKVHEIISVFSLYSSTYTKNGKVMNYFPIRDNSTPVTRIVKKYSNGENVIFGDNFDTLNQEAIIKTYNGKMPRSVIKYNVQIGKKLHPTQKPTELLEYLVKTYSKESDVILDFCMGSGSTGVACLNTQRNFIGIEIEEKWFNISKERLLPSM